ncbi:MAG: hypothetical protein ABJN40_07380 [Sneathiella sp.]
MSYLREFNIIAKAQADAIRQQNWDDLNRETSGVNTTRMSRFLSEEARDALQEAKGSNNGSSRKISTFDWLLINDPGYQALYQGVVEDNRATQSKLLNLQDRLDDAIETAHADIKDSLKGAVTLPDGRKAFLDDNGVAWTSDNKRVDDAITAGIDWTGRESRSSYLAKLKRLQDLKAIKADSHAAEQRLGDVTNKLQDRDPPPTKDQLKALKDDNKAIDKQIDGLNDKLESTLSQNKPDVTISNDVSLIKTPNLVPTL